MTLPVRRILVVDDEPKITEVVISYLSRTGFDPVSADTGAEALRLFEETAPALVILDLMLPDISRVRRSAGACAPAPECPSSCSRQRSRTRTR